MVPAGTVRTSPEGRGVGVLRRRDGRLAPCSDRVSLMQEDVSRVERV